MLWSISGACIGKNQTRQILERQKFQREIAPKNAKRRKKQVPVLRLFFLGNIDFLS
jgi:hypothetical protein